MEMERRDTVIEVLGICKQPLTWKDEREKTKSFAVSKQMVYNSYLKVCDKNGGAGIDKETIDKFMKTSEVICTKFGIAWHRVVIFHRRCVLY